MDNGQLTIIAPIIVFGVALRVLADRLDRGRIQEYVAERGGSVQSIA